MEVVGLLRPFLPPVFGRGGSASGVTQTREIAAMAYVVPKMKLIPQDKKMSCWYASGMMLIEWRRQTKMMSEAAHPDPSQVEKWQKLY